jgi:hypothetical protein
LPGDLIRIGGTTFGDPDDPRGSTEATEALERLVSLHYVKLAERGPQATLYRLSTAGWQRAESLSSED